MPADKATLQALLECDSTGRVLLKQLTAYQAGSRLKPPKVEIVNNRLTATAEVDSASIYVAWKQRDTTRTVSSVVIQPPIEVNRLTTWQAFQLWVGRIAIAYVAIRQLLKYLKPKIL